MYLLSKSYTTPQDNLDCDEQLLQQVNNGTLTQGVLRIWESPSYFVVLGLSKKADVDVHEAQCKQDNIPILKRCSGGGTVLQGPGCFNYGFILPMSFHADLASLHNTTTYILHTVQRILEPKVPDCALMGISDLAINHVKFSGNAQRRLKHALLFHGTILYNMDLGLVSKYLKEPPVQPDYRNKRPHQRFIQNLPITRTECEGLFTNAHTALGLNMPMEGLGV